MNSCVKPVTLWLSILLSWMVAQYDISEGVTHGCRPEDGRYQCAHGQCTFREYVLDDTVNCRDGSDQQSLLNCTDNELRDRIFGRCLPRLHSASFLSLYNLCSDREFVCEKSKQCLNRWQVKNGLHECNLIQSKELDFSDESVPLQFCYKEEFSCSGDNANNTLQCIPREWVGDRYTDCKGSGLDEKATLSECFNDTEFRCDSRRCIPRYRVMDNYPDCRDRSDERRPLACHKDTEYRCNNTGRCIPRSWRGNNIVNCPDGSDELPLLPGEKCKPDEVLCDNENRCIPKSFLCDGIDQCGDCSDEIENCEEPQMFRCPNDPSKKCVHVQYSCDGIIDCPNNGDDITSVTGFKCFRNLVGSNQQRYCVLPQSSLLDDIVQCDDESDICFDNGTFVCSYCLNNKTIIAPSQQCDGIFDCPDLSDECLCENNIVASKRSQPLCRNVCYDDNSISCQYCKSGEVFCPEERTCVNKTKICDGRIDCLTSGFDESFCGKTFEKQVNSTKDPFTCDKVPEGILLFLEGAKLDEVLTLIRNSQTAAPCNGIIECTFFEDECSERANCSNKPQVCNKIPLFSTDLASAGILLGIRYGIKDTTSTSFITRKCAGIVEHVIGRSICNGIEECASGFDENYCPRRHRCDAGEAAGFSFKPLPVVSIAPEKVCDGVIDCVDSSDELNCTDHFYCETGDTLFATSDQVLDGKADCDDRSDECPESYLSDSAISSNKFLIVSTALEFFLWLMAILALTGNGGVLITTAKFFHSNRGKGPSQRLNPTLAINKILICNLAVADFLMGIALLIIIVKTQQYAGNYCLQDKAWRSSDTCNFIGVITVISSEVSVFTLVCLTTYRLYHIIFPYKSREANANFSILWISLAWMISFFIAFIPFFRVFSPSMVTGMWIEDNNLFGSDIVTFLSLKQFARRLNTLNSSSLIDQDIYQDWYTLESFFKSDVSGKAPVTRGYFGYYSASGLCIPRFYKITGEEADVNALSPAIIIFNFCALFYIAIAYVIIYRRTMSKQIGATKMTQQQKKQASTLQRNVTILIATDVICWLPICIMTFISVGGIALPPEAYAVSAVILLPINSSINPLIYTNALSTAWMSIKRFITSVRPALSNRSTVLSNSINESVATTELK